MTTVVKAKIKEFECMRGVAAISILIYHYTRHFRSVYGHDYPEQYDLKFGGLELFLIMHGFTNLLALTKAGSEGEYLVKRISRLYPVYWLCMLTTFLCVRLVGLSGREASLSELLVGLTMFQSFFGVKSVDGAYWFLAPLLFFNLVMLLLYSKSLLSKQKLQLVTVLVMTGLLVVQTVFKGKSSIHATTYSLVLFFAGTIFYRLSKDRTSKSDLLLLGFSYLVSLYIDSYRIVPLTLCYGVFMLYVLGGLGWLRNNFLFFLGTISYPLYLIHQNVGFIIILYLKKLHVHPLLMIAVPLAVCVGFAWLVIRYYEKPVTSRLQALLEKALVSRQRAQEAKQVYK